MLEQVAVVLELILHIHRDRAAIPKLEKKAAISKPAKLFQGLLFFI